MNLAKFKPNFLIFICDHLTQRVIGEYQKRDNTQFKNHTSQNTPNIDRIAKNGTIFTNIYTNYPLCMPSRASFWTGKFPHQTGVISNQGQFPTPRITPDTNTLGDWLKKEGYGMYHFGKQHDHGALKGFKKRLQKAGKVKISPYAEWPLNYDSKGDANTTKQTVKFFTKRAKRIRKKSGTHPFFTVCDLNNPHNICAYVGAHEGPHQNAPLPEGIALPELPPNFDLNPSEWESLPLPIQYICCSHRRLSQASHWTRENYRYYLAAYEYYTRLADENIGKVLQALEQLPQATRENTYILVFADHGDGIASHRMVTKQVSFFEEMTNVPFILMGPGVPKGEVCTNLGSLIDLFPTICELANITPPTSAIGKTLLKIDGEFPKYREYIVSEWHTEWGFTISPGRMVRSKQFKYMHYIEGNGEALYDILEDPGEMHNRAQDPEFADILQQHRVYLREHCDKTNDPYFQLQPKVDTRWRSHPLGYPNHEGPSAPEINGK